MGPRTQEPLSQVTAAMGHTDEALALSHISEQRRGVNTGNLSGDVPDYTSGVEKDLVQTAQRS